MRVVECWHGLPRESVDAPSVEIFVLRLDGALSNFIYFEMLIAGAGLHDLLQVLSNLNQPGILFCRVHAGLYCLHMLRWVGDGEILTSDSILCPDGAGQLSVGTRAPALHRDILANWVQFPRLKFVIVPRTMPGREQGLPCAVLPFSLISHTGLNCCLPPKHPGWSFDLFLFYFFTFPPSCAAENPEQSFPEVSALYPAQVPTCFPNHRHTSRIQLPGLISIPCAS